MAGAFWRTNRTRSSQNAPPDRHPGLRMPVGSRSEVQLRYLRDVGEGNRPKATTPYGGVEPSLGGLRERTTVTFHTRTRTVVGQLWQIVDLAVLADAPWVRVGAVARRSSRTPVQASPSRCRVSARRRRCARRARWPPNSNSVAPWARHRRTRRRGHHLRPRNDMTPRPRGGPPAATRRAGSSARGTVGTRRPVRAGEGFA